MTSRPTYANPWGRNFLLASPYGPRSRASGRYELKVMCFEIGPGPGGLTRGLLFAKGPRRVSCGDRQRTNGCLPALAEISTPNPDRLDGHRRRRGSRLTPLAQSDRHRSALPRTCRTTWARAVGPLVDAARKWPPFWQSLTLMFHARG